MTLEYIRDAYHVPADFGRRVVVDGKPGVIVGSNDAHLMVLFNDEPFPQPAHPTWNVDYNPGSAA